MYTLIAAMLTPTWSGEIARRSFESREEAERTMARWARFGVDNYSTKVDALHIFDAAGSEITRWSWSEKKPVAVEPQPPSA